MAIDFDRALDTLDALVVRATAITGDDRLRVYEEMSKDTRSRLGYLGETVVLALAGGTGVGKSSLLNAIAGTQVVPTGTIRPTTDRPAVWLPVTPEPGLTRLLDSFGIDERVGHSGRLDVAVIDLPDFDSIDQRHKEIVEHLVPVVDAIVWVFDPQKYADHAVHEGYLRPLAAHGERLLFVLNQIDLLAPEELDLVRADLLTRLDEDGISGVELFTTVATSGRVSGVDGLIRFIEQRLRAKQLVLAKLTGDLHDAVRAIGEVVGGGEGLDFDRRWADVRDDVTDVLADCLAGQTATAVAERVGSRLSLRAGPAGLLPARRARVVRGPVHSQQVALAAQRIDALITDLAFEAGQHFGSRLRTRFTSADIRRDVERAAEAAKTVDVPDPVRSRWWTAASILQWVMVAVVVAAFGSRLAAPELFRRDSWFWIIGLGAAAALVGLVALARRSGSRAGRRVATQYRLQVRRRVSERLDALLGVELRKAIRDRAEVVGLLAELSIEAAVLGAARRPSV